MFDEMKKQVHDWEDKDEVTAYLRKLLHKEAFDQKGLIYGMGHAVYSISDPRAEMFKSFVEKLAKEKHRGKRVWPLRECRGACAEGNRRGTAHLQGCCCQR